MTAPLGRLPTMRYLSADVIFSLLSQAEIVAAVEKGALAAEEAAPPDRPHFTWGGNTLLVMPAFGERLFGTKLVSVIPGNAAKSLPVTNGLMVLNDAVTGLPVAILNAAALTARRTGAVGAMGLRYTTPSDVKAVGIIGCGVQGTWQAISACAVRPIERVYGVGGSGAKWEAFQEALSRRCPAVTIKRCADARELLGAVDVIIAATTSHSPVLPDHPDLVSGKHFVSIGSFKPSMQELPDCVYGLAGRVVLDSAAAGHEVGDILGPVNRGVLQAENAFTIGALIAGRRQLDLRQTTVFKSVGMALYDLFVAEAILGEAIRRNAGLEIPL
jgi:ornithine cyclodeaminase/alanine dehydrogenase-like protein (mu-crystallin family)